MGARGYVPLPSEPAVIAALLHRTLASDESRRASSRRIQLAKSELEAAFDAFPAPLVVVGPDLLVRRANRAALAQSRRASFNELLGERCCSVFGCGDGRNCPAHEAAAGARVSEFEFEAGGDSGVESEKEAYRCRAFPEKGARSDSGGLGDGALVLIEDITLQRREEAGHARKQQLEAVGLIAATLAHELNQPLSAILGRTQLAMMGLDKGAVEKDSLRRDLDEILEGVKRVSAILDRLDRVTDIVTKPYLDGMEILDLELSSGPGRGRAARG
jgi:hypothetical protein